MGKLPQTPKAKKVIEYAIEEARGLNPHYVDTEHLLLGLLRDQETVAAWVLMNLGLRLDRVRDEVRKVGEKPVPEGVGAGEAKQKTPALDTVGRDLTALARKGKVDMPVGRDEALVAAFAVLGCQERNNLLVVGEPGVGKTHFLRGLALVAQDGPPEWNRRRLVAVDPARLWIAPFGAPRAATLALIREVHKDRDIVLVLDGLALFIDPDRGLASRAVSTLFQAALGLAGLQIIATTTPNYYVNSLSSNDVIASRFQIVHLAPPSAEEMIEVLQSVRVRHEAHHGTRIKDEALKAAVQLSAGCTVRAYPGKAVELLDRACARTRVRALPRPPDLMKIDRQIEQLYQEKDNAVAEQDFEKAAHLRDQADKLKRHKETILRSWQEAMKNNQGVVDAEAVAAIVQRPGWGI
jgi:ATP-dependent Clp protease ATP-binding subunit ClpC